jgi:hypothetical protein
MNQTPPPQEVPELPPLPRTDIKVDAFGDVLPTDRRSFVMGDFYTADQMRAYAREALTQAVADAQRWRFVRRCARTGNHGEWVLTLDEPHGFLSVHGAFDHATDEAMRQGAQHE